MVRDIASKTRQCSWKQCVPVPAAGMWIYKNTLRPDFVKKRYHDRSPNRSEVDRKSNPDASRLCRGWAATGWCEGLFGPSVESHVLRGNGQPVVHLCAQHEAAYETFLSLAHIFFIFIAAIYCLLGLAKQGENEEIGAAAAREGK